MWLLLVVQAAATADGQQLRDEQVKGGKQPSLSSLLHAVERGASEVLPYVPQAVANPVDHTKVKKKRRRKKKDPYAGLTAEEKMYKKLHSFPQTELLKKKLKGLKLYTKEVQDYDHQLAKYDRDEDKELKEAELRRWKAKKAELAAEAAEEDGERWQEAEDDSRDAEEAEETGKAYVDLEDAKLRKHFDRGPGVPVVTPVTKPKPSSLLEATQQWESSVEREHPELTPEAFEAPFDRARRHFEMLQQGFERKLAKVDDENLRDHDEQEMDPAMRQRAEELRRAKKQQQKEAEARKAEKAERDKEFEKFREEHAQEEAEEDPERGMDHITDEHGHRQAVPQEYIKRLIHSSLTEEGLDDDSSFLELGRPRRAKRLHATSAKRKHAVHKWTVQGKHPHSLVEKRPHVHGPGVAHAGVHMAGPIDEDAAPEKTAYKAETPSEIEEADAFAAFQKKMAHIKASEAHDDALETKWLKNAEQYVPGHPHLERRNDDY